MPTPSHALSDKIAMTIDEAAAAIGVSRRTIYNRIASKDLASFLSCGRRLVRVDALHAMLDADEAKSRPARKVPQRAATSGSRPKNSSNSIDMSVGASA